MDTSKRRTQETLNTVEPIQTQDEPKALAVVQPPRPEVVTLRHPPRRTVIAFVDLETTGLDPWRHEILEIGVIRADAKSLEVIAQCEVRVAPERLQDASPEALRIAGYSPSEWEEASTVEVALARAAPLIDGAMVAGHNVGFDWAFLERAFEREGLPLPEVDATRLDTASLAWPLVATGELKSLSLDAVAGILGVERHPPHRALADARCALGVAKRLAHRMRQGSTTGRLKRVFVCHPYSEGPTANIGRLQRITRGLLREGVLPIAPQLYLPHLVDEATQRESSTDLSLELLRSCDELRVFGARVTPAMERELDAAALAGIPVHFEGQARS